MGRTKLKGGWALDPAMQCSGECCTLRSELMVDFSPTVAHSPDALNGNRFFGWILPTLRTSEFTVLQTVGLDAAVVSCHRI
jgi:hypothetical protein